MDVVPIDEVRGSEVFVFDYDQKWLTSGTAQQLDPGLQFYSGDQFLIAKKSHFGAFTESYHERWGEF